MAATEDDGDHEDDAGTALVRVLLAPSEAKRARIFVISMLRLPSTSPPRKIRTPLSPTYHPRSPLTIEEIIEATAKRRDRIGLARLEKPRARQRPFGRAPIGGEL
jgi:hypothetical protein